MFAQPSTPDPSRVRARRRQRVRASGRRQKAGWAAGSPAPRAPHDSRPEAGQPSPLLPHDSLSTTAGRVDTHPSRRGAERRLHDTPESRTRPLLRSYNSAGRGAGPSAAPLRLSTRLLCSLRNLHWLLALGTRRAASPRREVIGRRPCHSPGSPLFIGRRAAGVLNWVPGRGGFCQSATLGPGLRREEPAWARRARAAGCVCVCVQGPGWPRGGARRVAKPGRTAGAGGSRPTGGCAEAAARPTRGRLWLRAEEPGESPGQRLRRDGGGGGRCPGKTRPRCWPRTWWRSLR